MSESNCTSDPHKTTLFLYVALQNVKPEEIIEIPASSVSIDALDGTPYGSVSLDATLSSYSHIRLVDIMNIMRTIWHGHV